MYFNNKNIWITGASSGIGEALAYDFAKEGAKLILSSRKENQLQRVQAKCQELGAEAFVIPLDLVKHETIPGIVAQTIASHGPVDMLINNGGISQRSLVLDTDLEVDKRIFAVNYFGAIAMTKAILPNMLERNSGNIVVISSVAGKLSTPRRSSYCGSKHALHGFYDALRYELLDTNIKTTIICPGYIQTNISVNALTADGSPHAQMDDGQTNGMPVEVFSQKAIKAIKQGKNEVLIGGFETVGVYLKRFMPSLLSMIVKNRKTT